MLHQTNFKGPWEKEQNGNLEFFINGSEVKLLFKKIIYPATISDNITNTIPLPEIIRPMDIRMCLMLVQNGGTERNDVGRIMIKSDGFLIIGSNPNGTAFDATDSNVGFWSQTIIYNL